MIINTFTYANDLRVLLVEDFFPADLLEQLTEMCKTSETHPDDWHNPEWSKLRKIHNGNTETYKHLEETFRDPWFYKPLQVIFQRPGNDVYNLEYVECKLWADYPGFGPLAAHKENSSEIQGQIFLTDTTHPVNGTSMLNDDKELLFTLPFRNNYGWIMEKCQETMHSREFDVIPATVRYSLIFWYDYKARK